MEPFLVYLWHAHSIWCTSVYVDTANGSALVRCSAVNVVRRAEGVHSLCRIRSYLDQPKSIWSLLVVQSMTRTNAYRTRDKHMTWYMAHKVRTWYMPDKENWSTWPSVPSWTHNQTKRVLVPWGKLLAVGTKLGQAFHHVKFQSVLWRRYAKSCYPHILPQWSPTSGEF